MKKEGSYCVLGKGWMEGEEGGYGVDDGHPEGIGRLKWDKDIGSGVGCVVSG